ncbi:hypothetical protein NDA01_10665 [Trichocoleus desertorum AS-A10]|uniref:hypothetical protein n=1 Tax=Trichocoleus desertorum TaxID=1481672 RepID=UPI003297E151
MRQVKVIAFTGMLALLMSGCAGEGGDEQAASPTPSVAPTVVTQAPAKPSPKAQPFSAKKPPLVAQKTRTGAAAPALIQSTNPDERARQVQQGRQDPFALLPLPPVPVISPNATTPTAAPRAVPQVRTLPGASPVASRPNTTNPTNRSPGATRRSPGTTAGAGSPGRTNTAGARPGSRPTVAGATPIRPGTLPRSIPPAIAALPPLPQPALAQAVEVSGVVQVGEQAQAIIKAPNENTSRYVSVGQRLANGQVLVKRIEMNEGSDPIVIFEQYGIEVAKRVGERVQPATGTPTAAIFNAPWLSNGGSAAIS